MSRDRYTRPKQEGSRTTERKEGTTAGDLHPSLDLAEAAADQNDLSLPVVRDERGKSG
jgi:hypothetical protein